MRRSVLSAVLAAGLSLVACSDQPTEVTPPEAIPAPSGAAAVVGCPVTPTSGQILTLVNELLPNSPLRTSLIALINGLPSRFQDRLKLAVRRLIFPIEDLILRSFYAGRLKGGTSTATYDKVLDLIEALHCYVGLTPPTFPTTTSGSDIVVRVLFPNVAFDFSTPAGRAGLRGGAGAVTTEMGAVIVTISDLPDQPPPLRTSLDQYPRFYLFHGTTATDAAVQFNEDVIAATCLRSGFFGGNTNNLRLAHNVGPTFGEVEVLPRSAEIPTGVTCPDEVGSTGGGAEGSFAWARKIFLPAELHATSTVLVEVPVGGTTKKFSEFGIVDIFSNPGSFAPVGPTESTEEGVTVTRTVLVTSDNGTPIKDVPVTFTTEEGNGDVLTPQPVLTDEDGNASASWALPEGSGTFTLNVSVPDTDNQPLETGDPPTGNVASTPDVAFDPQSLTFTAFVGDFFSDGFEAAEPAWSPSPLWNRSTLKTEGGGSIFNSAFPAYVSLGSGDASSGALPAPFSGSFALWYGSPGTGNFIGTQVSGDGLLSGGTSTTSNSGDAQSPTFSIPASAPAAVLRFDTWFEIEGVNPDGFDIMSIWVKEGVTETFVGALNPSSAPVGQADKPFTTTGYNLAPAWQEKAFDLSSFKGTTISLIFRFDTRDAAYNGFRGWVIDNVKVNTDPLSIILLRMAQPASGNVEPPRRAR